MKKLVMTTAIVLGLGLTTFAQGSMFHRENSGNNGNAVYQERSFFAKEGGGPLTPGLPTHGLSESQNAPLGSGIAMLLGLGAAYAVAKKRREE
jgi:hypothetical protein